MLDASTGVVLAFLAIVASFAFGGGFFTGLFRYTDQPPEPPNDWERSQGYAPRVKSRWEYAAEVGIASFRKMFGFGFMAWVFAAAASIPVFFGWMFAWVLVTRGLMFVGLIGEGVVESGLHLPLGIAVLGLLHLAAQGVAARGAIREAMEEVTQVDRRSRPGISRETAKPQRPLPLRQEERNREKLRWVALLPGAVAGALVIDSLLHFLFFQAPYSAQVISAIGFNAGLVIVGVTIAPSRKRGVCLAMTVLSAGTGVAFAFSWLVLFREVAHWSDHLDWMARVASAFGAYLYLSHTLPKELADGSPVNPRQTSEPTLHQTN